MPSSRSYARYLARSIALAQAMMATGESRIDDPFPRRLSRRKGLVGRLSSQCMTYEKHHRDGLAGIIVQHHCSPEIALVLRILVFDATQVPIPVRGYDLELLLRSCGLLHAHRLDHALRFLGPEGVLVRAGVLEMDPKSRVIDNQVRFTPDAWNEIRTDAIPEGFLDSGETKPVSEVRRTRPVFGQAEPKAIEARPSRDLPLVLEPETARQFDELCEVTVRRSRAAAELQLDFLGDPHSAVFLFSGPPGCGKSSACEVLAHRLNKEVLFMTAGALLEGVVGETQKKMTKYFKAARREGFILVIDECDSLLGSRDRAQRNFEIGFVNHFLALVEQEPATVCLTTNRVSTIEPALERRLHGVLHFHPPGPLELAEIFRRLTFSLVLDDGVSLDALAKQYPMTGGEARNVVIELIGRLETLRSPVTTEMFKMAIASVRRRRFSELDVDDVRIGFRSTSERAVL